jgi:hypothetical protein
MQEILLTALVLSLPVLLYVALLLTGSGMVFRAARWAWQGLRQMLDNPNDKLVQLIAERVGQSPQWVVENVTHQLDDLIGMLPEDETTN